MRYFSIETQSAFLRLIMSQFIGRATGSIVKRNFELLRVSLNFFAAAFPCILTEIRVYPCKILF